MAASHSTFLTSFLHFRITGRADHDRFDTRMTSHFGSEVLSAPSRRCGIAPSPSSPLQQCCRRTRSFFNLTAFDLFTALLCISFSLLLFLYPLNRGMDPGLQGPLAHAAQARRRPILQRSATQPVPRRGLSLLAGVSDQDRRSRALAKFAKLETLINRVQTSPRPFSSAAWTHKIGPELREAKTAEQQARAVPASEDLRPEQASEEIEAFVEATDMLKSSVDLVSYLVLTENA